MSLDDIYQEVILDHNKKPRNFRITPEANHQAEGHNPLCGDSVHLYLVVENEVIRKASFQGVGCAISTASASLMTEAIEGKPIEEVNCLIQEFRDMLVLDTDPHLGKLEVLKGVKKYPMRVKCATLPWHALEAALRKDTTPATTE